MRHWIALCSVVAVACSTRAAPPFIDVRDVWARPADSAATTAVYLVIVNHDTSTIALASESSSMAESVTLHETMQMNGMVHMAALDAPHAIAPGDSLMLKPGSKHLMVSTLTRRLVAGDSLPLVLTFSDGRVIRATAVTRAP